MDNVFYWFHCVNVRFRYLNIFLPFIVKSYGSFLLSDCTFFTVMPFIGIRLHKIIEKNQPKKGE